MSKTFGVPNLLSAFVDKEGFWSGLLLLLDPPKKIADESLNQTFIVSLGFVSEL